MVNISVVKELGILIATSVTCLLHTERKDSAHREDGIYTIKATFLMSPLGDHRRFGAVVVRPFNMAASPGEVWV